VGSLLDGQGIVMASRLLKLLQDNPVIASVKDPEALGSVLRSDCRIVFLLYGSVLNIASIVQTLKEQGKIVFVDVDLIEGFGSKDIVITYLKIHTATDGVLSSKALMVKAAKEQGLYAVHRFFLIDSMSYQNVNKQLKASRAEAIEILPGCMPRVISWLVDDVTIPVIAGGLVCDKDDVVAALKAGAAAIASSNQGVWVM
jgi:glycerol uptake operon antiterminator